MIISHCNLLLNEEEILLMCPYCSPDVHKYQLIDMLNNQKENPSCNSYTGEIISRLIEKLYTATELEVNTVSLEILNLRIF